MEDKTFKIIFWIIFASAAFVIFVVWGSMAGLYYKVGHKLFSEGCTPVLIEKQVGNEKQMMVKCINNEDAVK